MHRIKISISQFSEDNPMQFFNKKLFFFFYCYFNWLTKKPTLIDLCEIANNHLTLRKMLGHGQNSHSTPKRKKIFELLFIY